MLVVIINIMCTQEHNNQSCYVDSQINIAAKLRYFCVHLTRPEVDLTSKTPDGEGWTFYSWHHRRIFSWTFDFNRQMELL